ncbi:MAG: flagellar capping protein [Lachnospiraceae bacterium]|nr:flagellar capping protein [Lachnospiraceae bacterium]MDY5870485.1 flagellar capping protein [Lachnospiraceae bacterium]
MAYNAAINTVYNHYLTTYAPKSTSKYDTHKKSELRSIYNSMVKLNKESPLYILDTSRESREYVIGLKENARQLRNTIASLGGLDEEEMLNKKSAYSSNEDIVSATFIGEVPEGGNVPPFHIEVTSLASNQVNLGTFLPSDEKAELAPDAYSFDITINDLSYEFQYSIHDGETNREVQERLARLITNADVGVNADILEDGNGNSSLRLTSVASGLKENKDYIFLVSDDKTTKRAGSVDYLGLGFMSRLPSNAEFLLNGESRSASSNHFTIDKMFELTLNGISPEEGQSAEIGLKTDLDSLTENVGNLIGGYNSFIKAASEYLDLHPRSGKLLNEMERMSQFYQPDLEKLGFVFNESGELSLNDEAFKNSILDESGHAQLSGIRNFTNSVLRKTDQISLNPIEYVDKKIVAYKNPGHNFATPYVTSNYSGMLFNSYC